MSTGTDHFVAFNNGNRLNAVLRSLTFFQTRGFVLEPIAHGGNPCIQSSRDFAYWCAFAAQLAGAIFALGSDRRGSELNRNARCGACRRCRVRLEMVRRSADILRSSSVHRQPPQIVATERREATAAAVPRWGGDYCPQTGPWSEPALLGADR
jgi:hypothetical protein